MVLWASHLHVVCSVFIGMLWYTDQSFEPQRENLHWRCQLSSCCQYYKLHTQAQLSFPFVSEKQIGKKFDKSALTVNWNYITPYSLHFNAWRQHRQRLCCQKFVTALTWCVCSLNLHWFICVITGISPFGAFHSYLIWFFC